MSIIFYAYARVSTKRQKNDLEKQIQKINSFTNFLGAVCKKVHSEISSADAQPELRKLMKKIKRESKNNSSKCFFVITNISRAFRGKKLAYKVQRFLKRQGIKTLCANERYKYLKQARFPSGEEIEKSINKKNSINAKTLEGRRSKVQNGEIVGHRMPFGFKGKFEVDEQQAEEVQRLFNQYLILGSIAKLESWAKQNDLGKTKSLGYMLKNEAYVGKHGFGKLMTRYSEPIINKNLFSKVQSMLRKNTKSKE
ncbi:recombinase family protein [Candidatus Uabimicrobium sp. HlEnr_7]|uniref:recombinase family protein n=1 Tax=Candidatus Uabimicrobium helgolandensis TaxID=3095367 RepID=UPI0035582CB2